MMKNRMLSGLMCVSAALIVQSAPPAYANDETSISRHEQSSAAASMKGIRASQILGVNVMSKQGDNLGEVQDLVFDAKTGKIQFALVGKGFMAGLGDRMIPVPWQAVDVRSQKEFVLNVDREKMQAAPMWSASESEQPDYIIRIYRFFEIQPDEAVGGPGSSGQQSGQGSGSSSDELNATTPPTLPDDEQDDDGNIDR
jgi:sporulation protein YlmC with PRC-barrel domain